MGLISEFIVLSEPPELNSKEWTARPDVGYAVDTWLPTHLEVLWELLADEAESGGFFPVQTCDEQWIYALAPAFLTRLSEVDDGECGQLAVELEESGEFNETAEQLNEVLATLGQMARAAKEQGQSMYFYNSL